MVGKRAKILSVDHVEDLLVFARQTRHPIRNQVLVVLSVKAGLRAGEIANLTWPMLAEPTGEIGMSLELQDRVAKRGSGRVIPIHPELRAALVKLARLTVGLDGPVIQSERGGPMTPVSILCNGHLNQIAYSLYLFIRDVAEGDLVGWIDDRLDQVNDQSAADRLAQVRTALIEPLRNVYGVSDKVLAMALSGILIGAAEVRPKWLQVGVHLIAVDTLVHNFLHRTGILRRFEASHPYGTGCYRAGGCAEIIARAAQQIDARAFNPAFPAIFPRFVQLAIWRYCSQQGFDVCNGNRVDDRHRCQNRHCRLYGICDRIFLK
jgi:hypothetical protein